ncbi:MAG: phytase, partial [Sphingomonas sp.]
LLRRAGLALMALAAAGCASAPPPPGDRTASVAARGETAPVATGADAADDPAIWRDRRHPAASLIVATDKKAGLHLYDLAGRHLDFAASPRLNNVDLRDGVTIAGRPGILIAASDRADEGQAKVALFALDPATRRLRALGNPAAGAGEAYGVCLWRAAKTKALYAFLVMKDGRIDQIALDASGATPTARIVRTLRLATQSEGCVADDRTGKLYVAEEDVGIWAFDADPAAPATPAPVAKVDGRMLTADVEGLAIAPRGRTGGWLVASSQGDNAYALFRLPDHAPAGRFRIAAGRFGATSQTDGIEVALGDFGPAYPGGLMIAQDGDNAPAAQNFKLVAWADIVRALGLR